MKKVFVVVSIILASIIFYGCTEKQEDNTKTMENKKPEVTITESEVIDAQKVWGEGIVKIGKVYSDGGDYTQAAREHIETLYGYDLGPVLFKPTLAAEKQFRPTFEGALSYFVGDNDNFSEDKGFAIKPWTNVRWESKGVKTEGNMAVAMGNYYFTTTEGDEVKVEYTFGYTKDDNGNLKIILHHSALPYNPEG